jgi:ubiquinone/menaquinone biosynthesis C-methylase UbiE
MAYKFNPEKKHKLNSDDRKKQMPPKRTLENMLVTKNVELLDIGAGVGYFSIPASQIVGQNGKVYAVDTSEEMLEELKQRIEQKDIENIELVKGKDYDTDIQNNNVDYILISNVLHEVEDKILFLSNYLNKLRPAGKVGIIEFKKIEASKGPPIEHKISREQLKEYFNKLDIEIIKEVDINEIQYGIVGKK